MCLIAFAPKKKLIKPEVLENAYINNSDGWGIVFLEDGRLHYHKRKANFETFLAVFDVVPPEAPVGVHFRWRTHGDMSIDNVHPYEIMNKDEGDPIDICLMHNGVIHGTDAYKRKTISKHSNYEIDDPNDQRSDTKLYIDGVLKPILEETPDIIHNLKFQRLIGRDIGSQNKLLIMTSKGPIIVNKLAGFEDEKEHPGVWFSNSYSLKTSNYRENRTTNSNGVNNWWANNQKKEDEKKATLKETTNITGTGTSNVSDLNDYTYETDVSPEIKALLKPGQFLIRRNNNKISPIWGCGWVKDTKENTYERKATLAILHMRMIHEREKAALEKQEEEPKSAQVFNLPESGGEVDLAKSMEKGYDTPQLRQMNGSEILAWVLEYPREASIYMQTHGFFGGINQIEQWVNDNLDSAAEYVHDVAHGKFSRTELDKRVPKDFSITQEQLQDWRDYIAM